MNNIFEMKDYKLSIAPEAYSLLPFKTIWDRDKSKDKSVALQELAYIWFMWSYKSDFMSESDDDTRHAQVVNACITIKNWKPDKDIQVACDFFKSKQETVVTKYVRDAIAGANRLGDYLRNVDLTLTTDKGSLVNNPTSIVAALKSTGAILENLKALLEAEKKERELVGGLRGNRKKGMYADE